MDGCPRQNPAYRLATENPRTRGPSIRGARAGRAVEVDLDGDARVLVAVGLPGSGPADARQPDLHRRGVGEVAPPALALRPVDADRPHLVAVTVVADGEGEGAPAAPSGHGQQRQMTAEQAVRRRAQDPAHDRVDEPVDDDEGRVGAGHHARSLIGPQARRFSDRLGDRRRARRGRRCRGSRRAASTCHRAASRAATAPAGTACSRWGMTFQCSATAAAAPDFTTTGCVRRRPAALDVRGQRVVVGVDQLAADEPLGVTRVRGRVDQDEPGVPRARGALRVDDRAGEIARATARRALGARARRQQHDRAERGDEACSYRRAESEPHRSPPDGRSGDATARREKRPVSAARRISASVDLLQISRSGASDSRGNSMVRIDLADEDELGPPRFQARRRLDHHQRRRRRRHDRGPARSSEPTCTAATATTRSPCIRTSTAARTSTATRATTRSRRSARRAWSAGTATTTSSR